MTKLNVALPENLKAFVDEQVAARGYGTASEYIGSLIREAQEQQEQQELEAKLVAAFGDEAEEMGKADWDELRARVRRIGAENPGS